MLDHADSERERVEIVCSIPEPAWEREGEDGEGSHPEDWNKNIHVGEWSLCPDGRLFRMVFVPPGIQWPPNGSASGVEIVHGDYALPRPRPVELPPPDED